MNDNTIITFHPSLVEVNYWQTICAMEAEHSYKPTIGNSFLTAHSKSKQLLGYIEFQIIIDEVHIYRVSIVSHQRQQGLATLLLKDLIVRYLGLSFYLEVASKNRVAIQLYHKCGFVKIGERNSYYQDKDTAFLMKRPIL